MGAAFGVSELFAYENLSALREVYESVKNITRSQITSSYFSTLK